GGEHCSGCYDTELVDSGIVRQQTICDTPEQNRVAERLNRTLEERVRATLVATRLPSRLWAEIWLATVKIYNHSPHSGINFKLPIVEIDPAHHSHPDVSRFRILGSTCYSHLPRDQRKTKLSPAGEKLILVGYSDTSKGYKLWNPVTDEILERYNVTVDESHQYDPADWPTSPVPGDRSPDLADPDIPLDADKDDIYIVDRITDHCYDPVQGYSFCIKWK
ncbi:MAG: hypothetical protein BJ554DRAFT_8131, partial [Olpidium bornovanus]